MIIVKFQFKRLKKAVTEWSVYKMKRYKRYKLFHSQEVLS